MRVIHGVQLIRANDLMLMLGFSGAMDQLAMINRMHLSLKVFRREDDHVLRRALVFEVNGLRKTGRLIRTWNKEVEEESMNVGLGREDALLIYVECLC